MQKITQEWFCDACDKSVAVQELQRPAGTASAAIGNLWERRHTYGYDLCDDCCEVFQKHNQAAFLTCSAFKPKQPEAA